MGPFVAEPVFAIFIPYHIMMLLLRSHKGVRGREAEKSLEIFIPMDLARYGDLLLNVTLTSLMFFFPAGEMLKLLLALIISHTFVYCYDKYRVLRAVPAFCFAGTGADERAQNILVLPCGFIAACIVFKGHCMSMSPLWIDGYLLFALCVTAFVLHVSVHLWLLNHIVPKFGRREKQQASESYAEVATDTPCTWFS